MSFAISGAVIGAGGAYLSAKQQSKAASKAAQAAQYTPYNFYGPSGTTKIGMDPATGERLVTAELGGRQQDISSFLLTDATQNLMGGGYGARTADALQMFGEMQRGLGIESLGINERLPAEAYASADVFGQLGLAQRGAGAAAISQAFNAPSAAGLTGMASAAGLDMLGATGQSFNQLAAERLSALRGAARPAEERAVNAKFQNLFNTGRLGTTGGAQAIGELAQSQELADMARITESQNFAQQQRNFEASNALQQRGLGASLLGTALQGIGMDQSRAGTLGQLGLGLFGQGSQAEAARLSAIGAGDQSLISRGNRRLQTAQSLFNFGQGAQTADLDRVATLLGIDQSQQQTLLDQARIGASVGQAQSTAAANAGALALKGGSPLGGALAGFGTGLMENEKLQQGVGNLFGKIF